MGLICTVQHDYNPVRQSRADQIKIVQAVELLWPILDTKNLTGMLARLLMRSPTTNKLFLRNLSRTDSYASVHLLFKLAKVKFYLPIYNDGFTIYL